MFKNVAERGRSHIAWVALLAGLTLTTSVRAEEKLVTTSHGPKSETRRLKKNREAPGSKNIVFVAEGYTATEKEEYFKDCLGVLETVALMPAWKVIEENAKPNFHFVFVPSDETGSGPVRGDSAFHASYFSAGDRGGEFLKTDGVKARMAAARLATGRLDVAVLLVKLKTMPDGLRSHASYPILGSPLVVLASSGPMALPHELGHALYGLGDEYVEDNRSTLTLPGSQKSTVEKSPNLTTSFRGKPEWKDFGAPVVEGGGTYGKGVYRPFSNCTMNDSGQGDFCPVCKAVMRKAAGKEMRPPKIVRLGFTTLDALLSPSDFSKYWSSMVPPEENEASRVHGTWVSTAKTTRPIVGWSQPTTGPQPTSFRVTVSARTAKTSLGTKTVVLAPNIHKYDLSSLLEALPKKVFCHRVTVAAVREQNSTPLETISAVATFNVHDAVPKSFLHSLSVKANGTSTSLSGFWAGGKAIWDRYGLSGSFSPKGQVHVGMAALGADVSVSWQFPKIENTGVSIASHNVELLVLPLDSATTKPVRTSWILGPTASSINLASFCPKTRPVALVVTYQLKVNELPDEAPETAVIFVGNVPTASQPSVPAAK
jgi:hypothetical protein